MVAAAEAKGGCGGGDDLLAVRIESRQRVVPSKPSHGGNLFLSSLDLVWQDMHYNRRLLFYDAEDEDEEDNKKNVSVKKKMEVLRQSLSQALLHYFPWAGRLVRSRHTPSGSVPRTSILCDDSGVEFLTASSPFPISTLRSAAFQIKPSFHHHLCPHIDPAAVHAPLLSVQVTVFSDGGLALGICHSHVVADGQALWNFMLCWATCARRIIHDKTDISTTQQLLLLHDPCHDRELLAIPHPLPALAKTDFVNFDMTEPDRAAVDDDLESSSSSSTEIAEAAPPPTDVDENEELTQCVLELAPEAVAALKKEAGGRYTSYEAMCAHMWQRVAAARSPGGRMDGKVTTLAVMANVRRCVRPEALPEGYFGNAVMFGEVAASVGELRRETLGCTAARVHECVEKAVRAEAVEGFMHWLELHECRAFPRFRPAGEGLAANMSVASSPRFPSYAVDFGWGSPAAVRAVKCGPGEMVLFGGRPDSPHLVEICLALPPDVLARLLQDPRFYATLPALPAARPNHHHPYPPN